MATELYTAKVFFDEKKIAEKSGNDLEELLSWMLSKASSEFGNIQGEIIDNKTKQVIKHFRRAPPDC